MGLFFADLVRERSTATGTGHFALAGALPGHRRFADAAPAGARFHYGITGVTHPDQWETGEGEIGEDGALRRDPLTSSAGGAPVDFAPGLKTVALTVAAAWFAAHDEAQAPAPSLAALAALAPAVDRVTYFTGPNSAALAPLSGFGRSLIGASGVAAARTQLGVGSDPVFGGTVHADGAALGGTVTAAAVSVGTSVQIGAVTATGGTPFSTLPPLGTATMGRIEHSSGWSGSGFLFANSLGGSKAFSMVYNLDTAYFGLIGTGGYVTAMSMRESGADFFGTVQLANNGVSVAGTRVVGLRCTGWSSPGGTAARASFDTASVTTTELAQRVKALIDDLLAHGLIGA